MFSGLVGAFVCDCCLGVKHGTQTPVTLTAQTSQRRARERERQRGNRERKKDMLRMRVGEEGMEEDGEREKKYTFR